MSVSMSVSMSVCMSVSMSVSISTSDSVSISVSVSVTCQLNTALRILSDVAIIQLISKARTRWRGNLKGLSRERGWTETYRLIPHSAKKISLDSPFKKVY